MKRSLGVMIAATLAGWATVSHGQPYYLERIDDVALTLVDLGSVEKVGDAVRYTAIDIHAFPMPIGPLEVPGASHVMLMDCAASRYREEETRYLDERGGLLPRGGPFEPDPEWYEVSDDEEISDTRRRLCFGVDDGTRLVPDLAQARRAYAITIAEDDASRPLFTPGRPMPGAGFYKHAFWDGFAKLFYRNLGTGLP